ncbi:metallophosphoesterase family protein [Sulfobacillus thermosulfidooxidans]|uniref:metallophosphoesterase family protein n=1 Tax=Sulfobacillus thermosulfidooxidans TaxID=28034 RepID=UPI0006B56005|nr:metallophosphoesterase [Sulfobacillus thermosulfidooxidans]
MGLCIVHLSDLHWENTLAQTPRHWDSLRRSLCLVQPDLIVVSGDLTSTGSAQREALVAAKQVLDSVGCEYVVVAGNHDLGANPVRGAAFPTIEAYEHCPWTETHFAQVFRQPPVLLWSQDHIHVVTISLRQGDPDGSLAQLTTILQRVDGPTLVFGHYPLVPVAAQGILAALGGRDYLGDTLNDLTAILKQSEHVVLYGCGHVHVASRRWLWREVWQYSAGALDTGASQFFVYWVEPTQMAYFSVLGNGPLAFWHDATQASIDHLDGEGSRTGYQRWSLLSAHKEA